MTDPRELLSKATARPWFVVGDPWGRGDWINAGYGFVAGIDVGPSRTRLGLADLRGELLARRVLPTPRDAAPRTLLRLMSEEIDRLSEETKLTRDRLLAVAVGVPGIVDPDLDENHELDTIKEITLSYTFYASDSEGS